MQNTANPSAVHRAQLSTIVSSHLHNITKILNNNLNCIDEYLKKSFNNQNLMCNTWKTRHLASEQGFASIEAQLARLRKNPQAPIVHSQQLYCIQQ